jgi:hypothetical protein
MEEDKSFASFRDRVPYTPIHARPKLAIAVRNVSGRRRWSKLSEWFRTVGPQ